MSFLVALAVLLSNAQEDKPRFLDVEIEKPFDGYLLSNRMLMEFDGGKIVRLEGGKVLVLGVASTPIRDGSAKDRKRAEIVCRNRALANILAEKKGTQVAHVEKLEKKIVVVIDSNGKETAKTVSEYLETTSSKLEGVVRAFPIIGRWKSADGKLYYLAIGGLLDSKGNRISMDERRK